MTSRPAVGPFDVDFAPVIRRFGSLGERVGILIDRQRKLWTRERSTWVVLPSLRKSDIRWTLLATDAEGERRAREVLRAFVGPAVGSVEPRRVGLPANEALDRVLQEAGLEHVAFLRVEGGDAPLVEALELMTSVRAGEPELRREVEDPIGFLLRDFHLALSSGDPDSSERLLERLEGTGLLAGENLRFLGVERLAKLSRWHELGSLPWFADLARARRPRHVTEYLLEALWRREFDDAEVFADAGAALRLFQERDLGSQFRSLLDAVDVPASTGGRRLAWLASVASGNEGRQQRLVEVVSEAERGVLEQLVRVGVAPVEQRHELSPLDRARSCVDYGDFVGAVAIAEETPDDPALVALGVRAAFELSDPELARRASALADRVGEDALPSTVGFLRNLRDVRQLATNQCTGWATWFARVSGDAAWPDAADVARSLQEGWDTAELRQQSVADSAANDLLSAADGVNALQIRAALDLICDLASELAAATGASSLTDAALLVLSMQDNPSSAVRNAFFALTADVLEAAPSASRYADLVKTATVLWERVRSRDTVSWALDVADVLAASPSPDPPARTAFVTSIGAGVSDFATRLALHERSLLEALAAECGTVVVLPPMPKGATVSQTVDVWGGLSGQLVGLYSLLGGIGARFAQRVGALNAEARIEHNSDTRATDALRSLAMTADFLIVDTRHAAHAATLGIDAVRPRDRQLFPAGRGLSSFISVLHDALERDRAEAGISV